MKTRRSTHTRLLKTTLAALSAAATLLVLTAPAHAEGNGLNQGISLIDYRPPTLKFNLPGIPTLGTTKRAVYLGTLNSNKYDPNSVSNLYGRYGSRYSPDSINNPFGKYGSRFSPQGVRNPFTSGGPKIYGEE